MDSKNPDATKRFCTWRLTQLLINEDDDIVHVHGCDNHFSQFLASPFTECGENVDIKTYLCLPSQSVEEELCGAHRELLL